MTLHLLVHFASYLFALTYDSPPAGAFCYLFLAFAYDSALAGACCLLFACFFI
jgi:hypothetical protein